MKATIMNKLGLILLAGFTAVSSTWAQDIHFSHFEYSPLTLNPALTGANSPMQAVLNYRNQWNKVGKPYSTFAASFDARLNEDKRMKKGHFAMGLNFFNDQAGMQRMSNSIANLNMAYHLILDRESTFGIGIYGGYGQRSFSSDGSQWMSQYDGISFNPGYVSGEDFNNPTFKYFDVGAGFVYAYNMKGGYMTQNIRKKVNIGFSAYHLNRPNQSFLSEDDADKLAIRYTAFINADIGIENTRGVLQPALYYQRQGGHQEIMIGTNYGYLIHEGSRATGFTRPITMFLGMFYRHTDAFIARLMFEYDLFSLGFSYDINISDLSTVTKTVGGFELFMRYNFGDGGGFRAAGKINRYRF